MHKSKWNNFCIVGMGDHTKKKIIPALLSCKKKIKAIVTSQNQKNYLSFQTLDEALKNLSEDTVYIIATPPQIHYDQMKQILTFGRDVIVEKPAFLYTKQAKEILQLSKLNNNIVFEAFMYRYSKLYKKFINFWSDNIDDIIYIKCDFYIPKIPNNTFRIQGDIASSCLYDMGCYSMSLLVDLGLTLDNIEVENICYKNKLIYSIELKAIIDGITIRLNFGGAKEYTNSVLVKTNKNITVTFWPFFYGRKSTKYVSHVFNNDIKIGEIDEIDDSNSFEEMFDMNYSDLLSNQNKRFKKMLLVTKKLEELAIELKKIKPLQ